MSSPRIYWIDRCLGTDVVPTALRDAGIEIRTYADLYPNNSNVLDEVWIPEVAGLDWVILTKDKNIRRSPVEITALRTVAYRTGDVSRPGSDRRSA